MDYESEIENAYARPRLELGAPGLSEVSRDLFMAT
jgi:hypothetical protein